MPNIRQLAAISIFLVVCAAVRADEVPAVKLIRVPDHGVQPQVAVDARHVLHMIYLTGDAHTSDVFYVTSADDGETFSVPRRVNSRPGSAVAIGTVRGAHMALGKNGRLHVAWPGSMSAEPKGVGKSQPMLYTRLDESGSFEPQRNIIQAYPGLNGGGSVAADEKGNVYVAWHAPAADEEREQGRRIWLSVSSDDGKTFAVEKSISSSTGVCGCCGMRLFAGPDGEIYSLYRSADQSIHRDMTLLRLPAGGSKPQSQIVDKMESGICVMSTSAFASGPREQVLAAWETRGQIHWSTVNANDGAREVFSVPGQTGARKHPAIAANDRGHVIVVWADGTGWNRGGTIGYQTYWQSGSESPRPLVAGKAESLPVWGAPAVFTRRDGSFGIAY